MYQPGEIVHYRSLTLDRFSLKPAQEPLRLTCELITPTGAHRPLLQGADGLRDEDGVEVLGPDKKPIRGVGVGEFILDPNTEGGEYVLVCREDANRFPEQRRKFIVNNYPKPQLDKHLDFGRSTYGPGDEVTAMCKAAWAGGALLPNAPVEATVLIDGTKYGADPANQGALAPGGQPLRFQTNDQGGVVVRFKLPTTIERGEASLGVKFVTVPETISRPLPIVLNKLNVEFYPEGGDLAADLPNRVYFQARTPLGKPADLTGRLLEDGQPLPVAVATMHDEKEPGVNQGMGRFEFTPKSGKTYTLQIDSPVGITEPVALPKVLDDRVVLSVPDGVADAGRPIQATVHSKTKRDLMVGLYCRGRLLQSAPLVKGDGKDETEFKAELNPEAGAGGVCRVTVFEEKATAQNRRELTPVAERLIYRRPTEQLAVHIQPDQLSYVPGQRTTLQIETLNEKGAAAPAVVMLTVVDKSVLTLADEKTYRSMPTHFLLTSEVRRPEDLEYADFLLGPQEKAKDALDLLLGVQGWRRFAEQDPAKFREKRNIDKEDAERLLVMSGQSTPCRTDLEAEEIKKVRQETDERVVALKDQYDQAAEEASAARTDPACTTATAAQASYDDMLNKVRTIGAPLIGAALLMAALAFLVLGLRNRWRRAVPWYAAAVASLALMIVAVGAYRMGAPQGPPAADDQVAWVNNLQVAEPPAAPPQPTGAGEEPDADNAAAANGLGGFAGGGAQRFAAPNGGPLAAAPGRHRRRCRRRRHRRRRPRPRWRRARRSPTGPRTCLPPPTRRTGTGKPSLLSRSPTMSAARRRTCWNKKNRAWEETTSRPARRASSCKRRPTLWPAQWMAPRTRGEAKDARDPKEVEQLARRALWEAEHGRLHGEAPARPGGFRRQGSECRGAGRQHGGGASTPTIITRPPNWACAPTSPRRYAGGPSWCCRTARPTFRSSCPTR